MMICFEVMKYQKKCSERRLNVAWISEFVEVKSFVWKMGGKRENIKIWTIFSRLCSNYT